MNKKRPTYKELEDLVWRLQREVREAKKAKKDLRERNRYLEVINHIANNLYGSMDYKTVAERAVESMMQYGNTSLGVALVMAEEGETLKLIHAQGFPKYLRKLSETLPVKGSLTGLAATNREVMVSHDILKDDRLEPNVRKYLLKECLRSVICVPVLFQANALAVINIFFEDHRTITDYEKSIFFSIGEIVGLAMGNARYLEQIETEIAERKKTEDALRESGEKHRLFIENANDAIFIYQGGAIKFANKSALNLLAYTEEELEKIQLCEIIHPEDRDTFIFNQEKCLKENSTENFKFRVTNKKGEEIWLEVNVILIERHGRPATLNFGRNVTERKHTEEEFIQAQKMEAIGTLAGGVAHNFNNLLMAVQGNISIMLMKMKPDDPNIARLKSMEEKVSAGRGLTAQLLGNVRRDNFKLESANINVVIRETLDAFKRINRDIRVFESYQKDIWPVEVDRGQIEQVLLNLYVNASHAMPLGGKLSVKTKNIVLEGKYTGSLKPGEYVEVSVGDTGIGMDAEVQKRIFEPFFTTKERGKGTGLGLAAAYVIIKNHGGAINVHSKESKGTTLSILIPVARKKARDKEDTPDTVVSLGSVKILLVDDEDTVLEATRGMLAGVGCQVVTAENGRKAVDLYRNSNGSIDLVILDMVMPEMGGVETYDKLKEINPEIKTIFVSGLCKERFAASILDKGDVEFLQKPFKMDKLVKLIKETLS